MDVPGALPCGLEFCNPDPRPHPGPAELSRKGTGLVHGIVTHIDFACSEWNVGCATDVPGTLAHCHALSFAVQVVSRYHMAAHVRLWCLGCRAHAGPCGALVPAGGGPVFRCAFSGARNDFKQHLNRGWRMMQQCGRRSRVWRAALSLQSSLRACRKGSALHCVLLAR